MLDPSEFACRPSISASSGRSLCSRSNSWEIDPEGSTFTRYRFVSSVPFFFATMAGPAAFEVESQVKPDLLALAASFLILGYESRIGLYRQHRHRLGRPQSLDAPFHGRRRLGQRRAQQIPPIVERTRQLRYLFCRVRLLALKAVFYPHFYGVPRKAPGKDGNGRFECHALACLPGVSNEDKPKLELRM
ncbi:MAG: hypothetical protein ABSH20_10945 [Tepidisphaeraceae bacterium]